MNENIKIEASSSLTVNETIFLQSILEKEYEKLKFMVKSEFILKVAVRTYSKSSEQNAKKRYNLSGELKGVPAKIEANCEDWDFHKACHMLAEKLSQETEHKFHSSDQNKRK